MGGPRDGTRRSPPNHSEPSESVQPGSPRQVRDSFVELLDGLDKLLFPRLVRGQLELALQFRSGKPEGLELPRLFRIATLGRLAGPLFFLLSFFHALGEAGFRVDEAFSSVTHSPDYTGGPDGLFLQSVESIDGACERTRPF
jgi:hypothetical protein